MTRGKFITLEGPEGSGKSTQIQFLAGRLRQRGREVLCTREPGGTPTGEIIRGILQHDESGDPISPEAEVLLFNASRAQLVRHVILPALEQGRWVVCDRFADSTTAYQGYGRGFDIDTMLLINRFAIDGAEPDLTILLDLEVETGFRRLQARHSGKGQGRDRIEREDLAFHQRVREGYMGLARRWPARFRVVDASERPEVVESRIWDTVEHAFREQL